MVRGWCTCRRVLTPQKPGRDARAGPFTRVVQSLGEVEDTLKEHGLLTRRSLRTRMGSGWVPAEQVALLSAAPAGSVFNPGTHTTAPRVGVLC